MTDLNETEATAGFPLLDLPIPKLIQHGPTAKTVAEAVGKHPAILEPKYDGWRVVARVCEDGCRLYTRSGQDITNRWPALRDALSALPTGTILDGEAVAFVEAQDGSMQPRWGVVQSILGSGDAKAALKSGALTYVAFDLLSHGGIDARALVLEQRRVLLEQLHSRGVLGACTILVPQFDPSEETHAALLDAGYEGSMVKWLDAPYRSGAEHKSWCKLKPQTTDEAIVVGFKPGTEGSSFDGLIGAIEFAQHDKTNGELTHRGRCSGMDFEVRVWVTANQDALLGEVFEFAHHGVMPPSEKNPHGGYRHPQWKRWRKDKAPEEVSF